MSRPLRQQVSVCWMHGLYQMFKNEFWDLSFNQSHASLCPETENIGLCSRSLLTKERFAARQNRQQQAHAFLLHASISLHYFDIDITHRVCKTKSCQEVSKPLHTSSYGRSSSKLHKQLPRFGRGLWELLRP